MTYVAHIERVQLNKWAYKDIDSKQAYRIIILIWCKLKAQLNEIHNKMSSFKIQLFDVQQS